MGSAIPVPRQALKRSIASTLAVSLSSPARSRQTLGAPIAISGIIGCDSGSATTQWVPAPSLRFAASNRLRQRHGGSSNFSSKSESAISAELAMVLAARTASLARNSSSVSASVRKLVTTILRGQHDDPWIRSASAILGRVQRPAKPQNAMVPSSPQSATDGALASRSKSTCSAVSALVLHFGSNPGRVPLAVLKLPDSQPDIQIRIDGSPGRTLTRKRRCFRIEKGMAHADHSLRAILASEKITTEVAFTDNPLWPRFCRMARSGGQNGL